MSQARQHEHDEIQRLSRLLELPIDAVGPCSDHDILLAAVHTLQRTNDTSPSIVSEAPTTPSNGGLHTGSDRLDQAIALLRLLYLSDLRRTQNSINDAIAVLQGKTAHPGTTLDPRLGRVGR